MTNLQAIIIAIGLALAGIGFAAAQVGKSIPDGVLGCVYYSSPPTLTNGQSYVLTCDSTGKLRVITS